MNQSTLSSANHIQIVTDPIIPRLGPNVLYKDARQYYDYLLNRVMIKFAPVKPESDDSTFTLALSRKMSYDQFSAKVGEYLKVDPTHLRFAPVATTTGNPKPFIRRNVAHNLSQILTTQYSAYGNSGQRSDALYYEVLETSLSEYETKKIIKITWLPEGIIKEVYFCPTLLFIFPFYFFFLWRVLISSFQYSNRLSYLCLNKETSLIFYKGFNKRLI